MWVGQKRPRDNVVILGAALGVFIVEVLVAVVVGYSQQSFADGVTVMGVAAAVDFIVVLPLAVFIAYLVDRRRSANQPER